MTSSTCWLHSIRQLLGAVLLLFVVACVKDAAGQTTYCRKYSSRSQDLQSLASDPRGWSCFLQNPCGGTGLGYSAFNVSVRCSSSSNTAGCEVLPSQYQGDCRRWLINTTNDGTACPSLTCCSGGSPAAADMVAFCSNQGQMCTENTPGVLGCAAATCPVGQVMSASGTCPPAPPPRLPPPPPPPMPDIIIDLRFSPPPPGTPPAPRPPPAAATPPPPLQQQQPPPVPAVGSSPDPFAGQQPPPPPPLSAAPPPVPAVLRMPPPPPPPASTGNYLGAQVRLTITLSAAFASVVDRISQFMTDLEAELAAAAGLPHANVRTTSVVAGSIIARAELFFPAATHTYAEAAAYAFAAQQAPGSLVSAAFQQMYGPVVASTAELTARLKDGSQAPPPPPSNQQQQGLSPAGIRGLVAAIFITLGLAGAAAAYLWHRRRRSRGEGYQQYPAAGGYFDRMFDRLSWWGAGGRFSWNDALPWQWGAAARQRRYQQQEELRRQDELLHSKPLSRMPRLVQGSLAGLRESSAGMRGSLAGSAGGGSSSGGGGSPSKHRPKQYSSRVESREGRQHHLPVKAADVAQQQQQQQ
ncbi:hypothetical protein OEZ86_008408 [Tetradesmus obliquus]|nr:hypothetical protein OEZ86_008408 [Tetradesmus obliquus]